MKKKIADLRELWVIGVPEGESMRQKTNFLKTFLIGEIKKSVDAKIIKFFLKSKHIQNNQYPDSSSQNTKN